MTCLNDFVAVSIALKTARKESIKPLHKFIFEYTGDRGNRQRIRDFRGFTFDENDDKYKTKCDYVNQELSIVDFTSICVILGLDHNEKDVKLHIFRNLRVGELLKDVNNDEDDSSTCGYDDDDDDDVRNVSQQLEKTVIPRQIQSDEDKQEEAEYNDDGDEADGEMSMMSDTRSLQSQRKYENDGDQRAMKNIPNQYPRFTLNFRDVEDSIRPFDGSSTMAVETWVQEFEETAAVLYWDQLQMFIFAKKSLRGLAKLFVAGSKGLTTWKKLKDALMLEFRMKVNSRQIHKMLTERSMKKDETVMEYLYKMKEMANSGNVVDSDLIQYVIDGINYINANKQMLYGARDLRGFKEKLRDYEVYAAKPSSSGKRSFEIKEAAKPSPHVKSNNTYNNNNQNNNRCYNCGENGHLSLNCKNKSKGAKCFRCNIFGHVAKDCKVEASNDKQEEVRCISAVKDNMMKQVKVEKKEVTALIDTGSMVNVMNAKTYESLKLMKLTAANVVLTGFGQANNKIRPMGCTSADVTIDGEIYKLTFCVIPDNFMSVDVVIGAPICQEAEITINAEGVHIKKSDIIDVMKIEVQMDGDTEYNIEETISNEAKDAVKKLVERYETKKSKFTNVAMKIVLTDETPIYSGARRLPLCQYPIVEAQIEEWLRDGVIEESVSEFSSPVVLVSKKDGSKRLCVDYRKINKVIVRDRFPLPVLEDQLDRLQDAKIFSTLDLKNGFFHVPVEPSSRKYTAFGVHNGQYQFCKVPFGLSNSPAVFQRFINSIFRELTQKGIAIPYVDDVIIPAKNEDEALTNLGKVLNIASEYGLNLNWKKCHFMKKRIEFLGHIIENHTISPSPAKMEAVMQYPVPKTLKQLESFLGLAGYFRKFIGGFAKVAKPLSDLRKKDVKFIIGEQQLASIAILKQKLSESPVLKIFNQQHETELHTDASADGYGAILLQKSPEDNKLHPCYFMSKKTTDLERKFTSYELEILAVVEALKKFRVYLLGTKFKIVTDCNALAKTMEKKDLCTRVARWLLLLQEYDYTIEHRAGTQMRHVDALSRCTVMMIGEETTLVRMANAQRNDENLKPIFDLLQQQQTYDGFYLKSGTLYKLVGERELLVVPSGMQWEIIKNAHE